MSKNSNNLIQISFTGVDEFQNLPKGMCCILMEVVKHVNFNNVVTLHSFNKKINYVRIF